MAARSLWRYFTSGSSLPRPIDLVAQLLLVRFPLFAEAFGIAFELQIAFEDRHARHLIVNALNIDGKRKPIEQLRPQIAFFGIHRADEDEARRVAERDAFALDHVDAHRRRVEQEIDHVIVEQVDFIDVQQAAIGRRQHARLEAANALLNRLLNVERADHAIFRGAHGQIDKLGAALGAAAASCPFLAARSRHSVHHVAG